MKRLVVIVYVGFLLAPFLHAQDSTPAPPPVEPQVPGQQPGPLRSSPPVQAVVPVPAPVAPPKPNGPVQIRLVRITATAVLTDSSSPSNAGGLQLDAGS